MIVIAGFGFVGHAYHEVFKSYFNLVIVDPKHNDNKLEELTGIKGVLCCVSTPPKDDGSCDITSVLDVISKTPENVPILIKSTIDLKGWQEIMQLYPNHKIAFSPEFLRAISAIQDLSSIDRVILSGNGVSFWREFYKRRFKKINVALYSVEEAILVKYFRNAFLATKVSFFNEIYDFCIQNNIDFDSVREGVALDHRIGHSHTFVDPEHVRGWGGYCFPKDTSALLKMAEDKKINLNTLAAAVEYNKIIRKNT